MLKNVPTPPTSDLAAPAILRAQKEANRAAAAAKSAEAAKAVEAAAEMGFRVLKMSTAYSQSREAHATKSSDESMPLG